jgi:hypothetical protein
MLSQTRIPFQKQAAPAWLATLLGEGGPLLNALSKAKKPASMAFNYGVPLGVGGKTVYEARQHGLDWPTSLGAGLGAGALATPSTWREAHGNVERAVLEGMTSNPQIYRSRPGLWVREALKQLAVKGSLTGIGVATSGLMQAAPTISNIRAITDSQLAEAASKAQEAANRATASTALPNVAKDLNEVSTNLAKTTGHLGDALSGISTGAQDAGNALQTAVNNIGSTATKAAPYAPHAAIAAALGIPAVYLLGQYLSRPDLRMSSSAARESFTSGAKGNGFGNTPTRRKRPQVTLKQPGEYRLTLNEQGGGNPLTAERFASGITEADKTADDAGVNLSLSPAQAKDFLDYMPAQDERKKNRLTLGGTLAGLGTVGLLGGGELYLGARAAMTAQDQAALQNFADIGNQFGPTIDPSKSVDEYTQRISRAMQSRVFGAPLHKLFEDARNTPGAAPSVVPPNHYLRLGQGPLTARNQLYDEQLSGQLYGPGHFIAPETRSKLHDVLRQWSKALNYPDVPYRQLNNDQQQAIWHVAHSSGFRLPAGQTSGLAGDTTQLSPEVDTANAAEIAKAVKELDKHMADPNAGGWMPRIAKGYGESMQQFLRYRNLAEQIGKYTALGGGAALGAYALYRLLSGHKKRKPPTLSAQQRDQLQEAASGVKSASCLLARFAR